MSACKAAIIGAGPIGLELAVYLQRAGVPYLHFDKGQIGQTIYGFPPQTRFFSSNDRIAIAGVPLQTADQAKAPREIYLAYLRSIVTAFGLNVHTYEEITEITRDSAGAFHLTARSLQDTCTYEAETVVLCIGGTARPRLLDVPGESLPHVSHFFEDPHRYFRKRLLVVGGRNSAVEAALRCYHAGAQVAISYRRAEFDPAHVKYWLLPELEGRIQRGEIKGHLATTVQGIDQNGVVLSSKESGETEKVPADFVLLQTGYVADMSLFRKIGVELAPPDDAPRYNRETMETNVPGVYVAGTAVGGTQTSYRVFIENCHVHAERICAALTGSAPPPLPLAHGLPES